MFEAQLKRLTWAQIDLKNYGYNFQKIKDIVGPSVAVMAVVKANAYGHGAVGIANKAIELGATYLGVVCLYEALELRDNDISAPILILNYLDAKGIPQAVKNNISITIMDMQALKYADKEAKKHGKRVQVHIKVDTGMHRAGIPNAQALQLILETQSYKNIFLQGLFTHFATSDEKDLSFTKEQLARFNVLLHELKKLQIQIPIVHCANSGATLRLAQTHFSMVRPGIILYGLAPSHDFALPFIPKPVMTLKTVIIQIKQIKKGDTVGYGRTFKATKNTLVGLLPIGYADGFRRTPYNWGEVLVHGIRAPLLGRVSMDQSTIDVSHIPRLQVGDEVVLIGKQGNQEITADDIAEKIGTINYEVVSSIASRVSRVIINQ